MIVLVSLIVLIRRLLVFTIFRMVHPYITVHSFLLTYFCEASASCARMRKPTALRIAITCRDGIVFSSPPEEVAHN